MKPILLLAFLSLIAFSCNRLSSTTYIDPDKSFVLGANLNHDSYRATVKNIRDAEVKVIQISKDGVKTELGILKAKESSSYRIAESNTIQFMNLSEKEAAIKIKAVGDTNLSMAYEENE